MRVVTQTTSNVSANRDGRAGFCRHITQSARDWSKWPVNSSSLAKSCRVGIWYKGFSFMETKDTHNGWIVESMYPSMHIVGNRSQSSIGFFCRTIHNWKTKKNLHQSVAKWKAMDHRNWTFRARLQVVVTTATIIYWEHSWWFFTQTDRKAPENAGRNAVWIISSRNRHLPGLILLDWRGWNGQYNQEPSFLCLILWSFNSRIKFFEH